MKVATPPTGQTTRWCVALLLLAGCNSPAAPDVVVHPVSGVVLGSDGKPLMGGALQFQEARGAATSLGSIGPDGRFMLRTNLADGRQVSGASPGAYRVTIFPPMDAPQSARPTTLAKTYRVEAHSNELTVKVE